MVVLAGPMHGKSIETGQSIEMVSDPEGVLEKGVFMNGKTVLAAALILVGILALVYGGFSYTKETHSAKIGPIDLSVKEKERINIPLWAGIGLVVVGGVLLIPRSK